MTPPTFMRFCKPHPNG